MPARRRRILGAAAVVLVLATGSGGVASAAPTSAPPFACAEAAALVGYLESLLDRLPGPAPVVELLLAKVETDVADHCVRLTDIQVLGTHNSYHVQPREPLFSLLRAIAPAADAWEYTHLPPGEQLADQGIRQLELDVFADPDGGRYLFRGGPLLVGESPLGPIPLVLPGMKVLHVQHLDFETSCLLLVGCLRQLEAWSRAHPRHLPVMVLIEAKDDPLLPNGPPESAPVPFDSAQFDALDAEIRSVLSEDRLFTPDDLRGDHPTLEDAVLTEGWPTLGELRGRVLFLLDNTGAKRATYLEGHPSLEGRVMFTSSSPGQADAAFVKVNDPLADPARIPALVTSGYLVRTRADADTEQARNGDTTRRDAALASGAQMISTDFPVPGPAPDFSGYFVEIPGGSPARCNPVRLVPGCRDDALETAD